MGSYWLPCWAVIYRTDTESSCKDKREQMKMMTSSYSLPMPVVWHLGSYKKRTCGNHYPDSLISVFDRVARLMDGGWFWKQRVLILKALDRVPGPFS